MTRGAGALVGGWVIILTVGTGHGHTGESVPELTGWAVSTVGGDALEAVPGVAEGAVLRDEEAFGAVPVGALGTVGICGLASDAVPGGACGTVINHLDASGPVIIVVLGALAASENTILSVPEGSGGTLVHGDALPAVPDLPGLAIIVRVDAAISVPDQV